MWLSYNQVIKVGITVFKGKTPVRLIQERDVKEALGTEIEWWGKNCGPLPKARRQKDPSLQPSRVRAKPHLISNFNHRIVRINV